jgi:NCAIR mutase (PurE)-related protein
LQKKFPEGQFDKLAKAFVIRPEEPLATKGNVLILTAGTSDLGIAMEAKYTLELCGCGVELVSDVGVAGLHRLFAEVSRLRKADALIVVAGMEGALPSVVGGLVRCPVIAVPTSVGYGAALNGITALLGMLNSCASGVTVVNIDNGFGAGCAAARIVNK